MKTFEDTAVRHQALSSYLLVLLTLQIFLINPVAGQANSTFVDQSEYTTFELYKNTDLRPCPINYTAAAISGLVPREPRRGGGGGGGGTRGGGTTDEFVESTWVGNQDEYCKHMTGIPIMIPTLPTPNAFTPWWPTFTMQFVSLLITWIGLWWTTRTIERNPEAGDMSLPITFWIQLPVDICRIVAWFVRTIRGFAVARQFSWVSVILWLVPFNYIWITRLLDAQRENNLPNAQQDPAQKGEFGQSGEQTVAYYGNPPVPEHDTKRWGFQSVTEHTSFRTRSKLYWVPATFIIITVVQWCMSLVVVALHFRYSWISRKNHPTYVETSHAVSDPSSIAPMPQACLNWLQQSSGLVASELLDMHLVQVVFTLIHAIQFIACTVVVLFRASGRYRILGKLKVSAWASLASLGLPALGTGMWILGKVVFGNQDTWITYTHNITATGGCTFAAVTMDRQWGYWDVQYERPIRITMSALGVA